MDFWIYILICWWTNILICWCIDVLMYWCIDGEMDFCIFWLLTFLIIGFMGWWIGWWMDGLKEGLVSLCIDGSMERLMDLWKDGWIFRGCFLDDKWMMDRIIDASQMMNNALVMLLSRKYIYCWLTCLCWICSGKMISFMLNPCWNQSQVTIPSLTEAYLLLLLLYSPYHSW